jgi:hypothetical protein
LTKKYTKNLIKKSTKKIPKVTEPADGLEWHRWLDPTTGAKLVEIGVPLRRLTSAPLTFQVLDTSVPTIEGRYSYRGRVIVFSGPGIWPGNWNLLEFRSII